MTSEEKHKIVLGEETQVTYHQFEIELDDATAERLIELGLELIKDDPGELINYAANRLFRDHIAQIERDECEKN